MPKTYICRKIRSPPFCTVLTADTTAYIKITKHSTQKLSTTRKRWTAWEHPDRTSIIMKIRCVSCQMSELHLNSFENDYWYLLIYSINFTWVLYIRDEQKHTFKTVVREKYYIILIPEIHVYWRKARPLCTILSH